MRYFRLHRRPVWREPLLGAFLALVGMCLFPSAPITAAPVQSALALLFVSIGAMILIAWVLGSPADTRSRGRMVGGTHCAECGYNLTGNTSGTCPECGRNI